MSSKHKILLTLGFGLSLASSIAIFGNACSKEFVTSDSWVKSGSVEQSSLSDTLAPMETTNVGLKVIPGTKTASVVYGNQILDHLTSCVGVSRPSEDTIKVYDQKKGAISVYGTATTITAPMMMSVISISAEVCKDLIKQEKIKPKIFPGFNFSANSLPANSDIQNAITRLSLSCWQRRENSTEKQILTTVLENISNSESQATEKSALMLCTSVLSSLDSVLN